MQKVANYSVSNCLLGTKLNFIKPSSPHAAKSVILSPSFDFSSPQAAFKFRHSRPPSRFVPILFPSFRKPQFCRGGLLSVEHGRAFWPLAAVTCDINKCTARCRVRRYVLRHGKFQSNSGEFTAQRTLIRGCETLANIALRNECNQKWDHATSSNTVMALEVQLATGGPSRGVMFPLHEFRSRSHHNNPSLHSLHHA